MSILTPLDVEHPCDDGGENNPWLRDRADGQDRIPENNLVDDKPRANNNDVIRRTRNTATKIVCIRNTFMRGHSRNKNRKIVTILRDIHGDRNTMV